MQKLSPTKFCLDRFYCNYKIFDTQRKWRNCTNSLNSNFFKKNMNRFYFFINNHLCQYQLDTIVYVFLRKKIKIHAVPLDLWTHLDLVKHPGIQFRRLWSSKVFLIWCIHLSKDMITTSSWKKLTELTYYQAKKKHYMFLLTF